MRVRALNDKEKSETGIRTDPGAALAELARSAGRAAEAGGGRGLPPVHLWNPEFCGDLDMRIARDGLWYYMGTPIGRERLVRLFSTVLRKDDDRYFLVTPVEKIGIAVDDVPFVANRMAVDGEGTGQVLAFETNVGDRVVAGADHPLWFTPAEGPDAEEGEVTPYVLVRARLEARISRPVFFELVDLGVDYEVDGVMQFGVWSSGCFFPIVPTATIAHLR